MLATSEFIRPVFASAFRTENVLVSGYPRNDSMLSGEVENVYTDGEQALLDEIRRKVEAGGLRVVYYMPTFRGSEVKFFDAVELGRLNHFLEENRLLLCVKLHPKSKLCSKFEEIGGKNIVVIGADTDPYVFIEDSDMLVTDYSSIYFDYLLSGKPIVFFDYDLEEYLRDAREMYFDYDEYTPGRKAETQEGLEAAVLAALADPQAYRKERERMAEKMFRNGKVPACSRLTREVKKILQKRGER